MLFDADGMPMLVTVFQMGEQEIRLLELQRLTHGGRVYSVFVDEAEAIRVAEEVKAEGESEAPALFLSERQGQGIVPVTDPGTEAMLRDALVDGFNRMAGLVKAS